MLLAAHHAGRLQFFGDHARTSAGKAAFKAYLAPLHRTKWFVYSKRPFAGSEQVLAYLSRYTHRVAISNSRLIAADATGVTFSYKDYRIEGPGRGKTMTLKPDEFIRRFLIHVLPCGFPAHQALRSAGQWHQGRDHRAGASASCCGGTCPSRAPAAAFRWCRSRRPGDPPVSVLRWPHEHHRDVRARLDTASPADRSNHHRQDRYVMITIDVLKWCTDNLAPPSVADRRRPRSTPKMRRPDNSASLQPTHSITVSIINPSYRCLPTK